MKKEQKYDRSLLDLTVKERALKERDAEKFLDAVEYWDIPDFRYPELHIDMAGDVDISKKGDLRTTAEKMEDYRFGKTKADLLLLWAKWEKNNPEELSYEYSGCEGENFEKAEMFLVRNEENNQPELIISFTGVNGRMFFPFNTELVVAMLQKLRENDAEEPLSLKSVY